MTARLLAWVSSWLQRLIDVTDPPHFGNDSDDPWGR